MPAWRSGLRVLGLMRHRPGLDVAAIESRGARGIAPAIVQSHSDEKLALLPVPPPGATEVVLGGVLLPLER